MIKDNKITKSLSDASLSEIISQLEYTTKWEGKIMYKMATIIKVVKYSQNVTIKMK